MTGRARIDGSVKEEAAAVLEAMGLTVSGAVRRIPAESLSCGRSCAGDAGSHPIRRRGRCGRGSGPHAHRFHRRSGRSGRAAAPTRSSRRPASGSWPPRPTGWPSGTGPAGGCPERRARVRPQLPPALIPARHTPRPPGDAPGSRRRSRACIAHARYLHLHAGRGNIRPRSGRTPGRDASASVPAHRAARNRLFGQRVIRRCTGCPGVPLQRIDSEPTRRRPARPGPGSSGGPPRGWRTVRRGRIQPRRWPARRWRRARRPSPPRLRSRTARPSRGR